MPVSFNTSALKQTRWYQYAVRLLLGGLITAIAGLIAKKCGPNFGGLFLAFPAILPASATLIEKHERERKEKKGLHGTVTAKKAVAADAAGASLGSVALLAFAWFVWKTLQQLPVWQTLLAATAIWLMVSVLLWFVRKRHLLRRSLRTVWATNRRYPTDTKEGVPDRRH
jgi:Kef-type K+ transport system membrane component KefB